jgi:hypothetical protein
MSDLDQEVKAARERLQARFGGNKTQMGGKGKSPLDFLLSLINFHFSNFVLFYNIIGSQRRVHKKHSNAGPVHQEDKKLMAAVNKFCKCLTEFCRFFAVPRIPL